MTTEASDRTRYRFAEFELRPDQGELLCDGRTVNIQPQPLTVLTVLVSRSGDLVRRSELFAEVWDAETHVDFDRGLNFCIKQIRSALGDEASEPRFIRTVPRYGYRFIGEVERVSKEAKDAPEQRGSSRLLRVAVAALLAAFLLGAVWQFTSESSARQGTDSRAMQEYLRGRFLAESGSLDDATESLRHFERAVAIDPDFARAHLAMAQTLVRVPGDPMASAARSRRAVLRALALDDSLAEAHAHLAAIKLYGDWDWEGTDKSYRRALELRPASAELRHGYASFLSLMGRHDEAVAEVERAMAIDPVSTVIKADAGWFYFQARRFDEAVGICELTLELDPDNLNALWCLLQAHRHAEREVDAVRAAQQLADRMADPMMNDEPLKFARLEPFWHWYLGWLEQNPHASSPTAVGLAHLALGDRGRALEMFETAYESHASCVLAIGADPQLQPLRGDPQFENLLARLGLPRQTPPKN